MPSRCSPRNAPGNGLFSLLLSLMLLAGGCSGGGTANPPPAAAAANPAAAAVTSARAEQAHCLALSMYWEAKAEGRAGMRAVGHVILNRMASPRFPDTPCAVVYEGGETPPCQFSWYCDGRSDKPTEATNWATAQGLAQELLEGKLRDTTGNAVFFHATRLKTPWKVPRTKTVTIGKHVFYKL
ncbi:MAG: cell wall hydrolase [Pseudomonadota bacterium]